MKILAMCLLFLTGGAFASTAREALLELENGVPVVELADEVGLGELLDRDNLVVMLPSLEALGNFEGLSREQVIKVLSDHVIINTQDQFYAGNYLTVGGEINLLVTGMRGIIIRDRRDCSRLDYRDRLGTSTISNYSLKGRIFQLGNQVLGVTSCKK